MVMRWQRDVLSEWFPMSSERKLSFRQSRILQHLVCVLGLAAELLGKLIGEDILWHYAWRRTCTAVSKYGLYNLERIGGVCGQTLLELWVCWFPSVIIQATHGIGGPHVIVPSKVSLGYAYMPRTTNMSSGVSEHSPEAAYLHFYDLEPGTIQAVRYITQKRPVENRRHIYLSSGMPAIAHHLDCGREG
jgi:hypothetical protein